MVYGPNAPGLPPGMTKATPGFPPQQPAEWVRTRTGRTAVAGLHGAARPTAF